MDQIDWTRKPPPPPRPRNRIARRSDPPSSDAAAEEVTASGRRDKQAALVLAAVKAHPGMTSRELAVAEGLDRYVTARRLPELEKLGRIVRGEKAHCKVSMQEELLVRKAVTWWPVED